MQIRFNLAFTNHFLSLIMYLDNGARCTETSVPITNNNNNNNNNNNKYM